MDAGWPKHLIRLLVALLKHQARTWLGEEFMEAAGDALADIGGEELQAGLDRWLRAPQTAHQLLEAARRAEAYAQAHCADPALRGALTLRFADLSAVQAALADLPAALDESGVEQALQAALARDLPALTSTQREQAARLYTDALLRAVSPLKEFTLPVIARTVRDIREEQRKQTAMLREVLQWLEQGETLGPEKADALQQALIQGQLTAQGDISGSVVIIGYGNQVILGPDQVARLRRQVTLPGDLPPGSYLPFPRNALFTGRGEELQRLAEVLALTPTPQPPPPLPLVGEGEGGPPSAAREGVRASYVWAEPVRPVSNPPADLVQRLNDEVRRIVDAGGHLLPYFLERGFTTHMLFPGDSLYPADGLATCQPGNIYWFDPGELVYTLSIAYPYLSSDLQSRVRSYLSAEMARYPPLQPLPWPPEWLTNGIARESYPVSFRPSCWPPPDPPLSTLYALWAYARYTGDWAYVQNRWSQIDALFDRKKGSIDSYAAISGAIGYARIAQHLGRTADAAEGERVAVAAMTRGLNFQQFLTTANARYPDPRNQQTGWRAPVFFGLVPEVGRYISDTNRITAMAYLNDLTDSDGVFLWYITRLGLQGEIGESSFHGPDLAWSIFLARAYVMGDTQETLRGWLDRPWGLGDLYFIQKLVATIEAQPEGPNLSASTKRPSAPTARTSDVLTYTILLRNTGRSFTDTVVLTDTIPIGLAYVPGSMTATSGTPSALAAPTLRWTGVLSETRDVTITYRVMVTVPAGVARVISNTVTIAAPSIAPLTRTATIIVNGYKMFLPVILRES